MPFHMASSRLSVLGPCLSRAASSSVPEAGSFINKNPVNLERLRVARKQQGWKLEPESKAFWNRVRLVASPRQTSAHVEHHSGRTLVSASTAELCVRRHLFSGADVAAAENVGRLLARRCLQAGVTELQLTVGEEELQRSEKLRLFVSALQRAGLSLQEPGEIRPEPWWTKYREPKPWHVPEHSL